MRMSVLGSSGRRFMQSRLFELRKKYICQKCSYGCLTPVIDIPRQDSNQFFHLKDTRWGALTDPGVNRGEDLDWEWKLRVGFACMYVC